ncbi:MAG TPA: aspartyl protease family protein [Opitutaceae bacterium]|nr:aspartyl protease family protein [Opitutaceae bacterium]
MKPAARRPSPRDRHPAARGWISLFFATLVVAIFAGCSVIPFRRAPLRPGHTTITSPLVELSAQNIGNYLVLEAKWDRSGPYHFLIDTGSSVTLVTPALVKRYPGRIEPPPNAPHVRVASAEGNITELPAASLRRLELGDAKFDDVPVLVYDCAPISAHLGVKIDGVLGFPLFGELLLTLDYPGSRVLLQPARTAPLVPGATIAFDDARKTPVIHVGLGSRSLVALIDSGSDAAFSLNPIGIDPRFVSGPRTGAMVGTLGGDRPQQIGRIADPLVIGGYVLPQPIVDLTDELSAIGGGVLKNFAVTFDQMHDRVTFHRDSRDPIFSAPRRSVGLSFSKTPAYWKIAGVVHDSPAEQAGVAVGDLVTRIDNEPVANWDLRRYEQLVSRANTVAFTFLNGTAETTKSVNVFDLVP